MREGPYTPKGMDAARGAAESRDSRFDELYAEAKSTLGYGANNLRSVTERYREAYRDTLGRWHRLRDEVEVADRAPLSQSDKSDPAAAAEAADLDPLLRRAFPGFDERAAGRARIHGKPEIRPAQPQSRPRRWFGFPAQQVEPVVRQRSDR